MLWVWEIKRKRFHGKYCYINQHTQGQRAQVNVRTRKEQGNTASKYRLMGITAFIIYQLALHRSIQCFKSLGQKYNKIPLVKICKTTKLEYHCLILVLFTIKEKKMETT